MKALDSFTVERLEELTALSFPPSHHELTALARIALAAKRAEPIYQYQSGVCMFDDIEWVWDDCDKGFYVQYDPTRRRIVYTTPQLNSPEIPEGWKMGKFGYQDLFNAIAAAVTSPHAGGFSISVKAFEDAMLAAAATTQQQIIPEGWISCSNRMPEPETPVLILLNGIINIGEIRWDTPTHEETYTAFKYWDSPFIDGQPWEVYDITHWMPLPAAPEKENG
ncbi:DUF551 domain-containing protein [Yersinia enterocolitica]|uniref:DUF551 domain-containing protein n=1 Tax=Yersinia enterocolitica TaxID=630 RepID=UPI003D01AC8E